MISMPTSLPNILKFICDKDESIKYRPLAFVGYINDLYHGDTAVADDYVAALRTLQPKICNRSLTKSDLLTIIICDNNNEKKRKVQIELLKATYFSDESIDTNLLDDIILKVYGGSNPIETKKHKIGATSSISFFNADTIEPVEYGKVLFLSWECINPYKIVLFGGGDYMDVSNINSFLISAIYDHYVLVLYSKNGEAIDTKEIQIQYWKNSFCYNCGNRCYRSNDIYCTYCGCKL